MLAFCTTSKIDDVLTEHGGLLHVLPVAVHLNFIFTRIVGGTILKLYYSLSFLWDPSFMLMVAPMILVSAPVPLGLIWVLTWVGYIVRKRKTLIILKFENLMFMGFLENSTKLCFPLFSSWQRRSGNCVSKSPACTFSAL